MKILGNFKEVRKNRNIRYISNVNKGIKPFLIDQLKSVYDKKNILLVLDNNNEINYYYKILANYLKKPFILLRKKNKLPAEVHSIDFELEYGKATIEVHKDSIEKKEKILVIDDLIATGGTAEAAAKLIEISGGEVAGFIFVINLFDLPGNNLLKKRGYKTQSLIEFPGH